MNAFTRVIYIVFVYIVVLAPFKVTSFDCDTLPTPKSYVAYQLRQGESIQIDGKLDDKAWLDVKTTDDFIDIQGEDFPKPRLDTWVKIRWDDTYLYIGGYLQETDVFANQTKHDSVVFLDNDFEVFTDPDGSTHWYKEFEINAINTVWDLELDKPYLNGGSANSSFEMPSMKSAVFVDGPVNNPKIKNKYWTVEIAMPFKDLVRQTCKATAPPKHGDQWRINFSRVEWHVQNVDGHYEKISGLPEDNWVWSPQHAINMHLPERWGILQFSTDTVNSTKFTRDPNWPVYSSLVEVYNAQKKFFAIEGYFTEILNQLDLPDWVTKGLCTKTPNITVIKTYNFNATVVPINQSLPSGYVRDDRLIWFSGASLF
ncbi:uncharacterized protein LOC100368858 [Saccoglossus kowalevskii]|uniref:Uncharacterized protein LOC100368858 n=1 Tax=Saccoglossus kowalevskii TaxID=10224 RepID=A0ABM0MY38_SACKO|nr:PREDICTED: uncharacterized protein LOC100368858 [Saccoglossus kowalevskii]